MRVFLRIVHNDKDCLKGITRPFKSARFAKPAIGLEQLSKSERIVEK